MLVLRDRSCAARLAPISDTVQFAPDLCFVQRRRSQTCEHLVTDGVHDDPICDEFPGGQEVDFAESSRRFGQVHDSHVVRLRGDEVSSRRQ